MLKTEVIIVGGGPAGSACAWRLRQNNVDCVVLDQQRFPRFKPCAGWITPQVVRALELDPAKYPHSFTTFKDFHISFRGFRFKLPAQQHAIRRFEFDDWMLQRADVPVHQHTVQSITRTADGYDIDGKFSARYLIGAGGTHCPVYRSFFEAASPRNKKGLIVAMEEEFAYPYEDNHCHLWYLENHLPGYAWYVPKANGFLNIGIGGSSAKLKARGEPLKNHWKRLVEDLERKGLVRGHDYKPSGHSYYLRQNLPEIRKDNAFIVGDAACLATLDMGEGIGPAIHSGLLAAESILNNTPYVAASIPKFSQPGPLHLNFT
jgi:flavin-dependent dehydrogenase